MSRINDPSEAIGNTTDRIRDKASEVTQNLRDAGSHLRDAATDKFNTARDQAVDYYNKGRETATEWEQSLETYVQEKPLQSVLIAAGVGLLLGLLWKRS